ncbi:hypothetical protein BDP27DRAFT_319191 [Rhodocollybia butyracea]|uniref:Transcription factor domain-containing protein n=1 Tax=Rhodocollybia butyracea TaxID=206335 RepID=A0A9P5Q378_9AGAR|nr:hypothetical protein BDP27DRAFT_319191 [Rhodocollybia butyracea]
MAMGPPTSPSMRTKTPRNLNRAKCSQCQARSKTGRCGLVCEYPVVGQTRKQTLEESISTLEKRIRELERAEPDDDSVKLYDPSSYLSTSSSPVATSSSSPSSRNSLLFDSATPEPSLFVTAVQEDPEVPTALEQQLLQVFVPHARTFGFFLNINRFVTNLSLPQTVGDYYRPCAALLCVVYLIGLHLYGASEDEESAFLSRALSHLSHVLSSTHPLRLLHGTQAEILLSTYFFRTGRILEAKHHLSSAVSLATCAGLHRLRSGSTSSFSPGLVGIAESSLPLPKDVIDEGERINGFWTTFTLCNCWGVGVGGFSSMVFESYGSHIDTPWPLDMEDYEENRMPTTYCGASTIRNFLTQAPLQWNEPSKTAMFAQSSLLLERAANLASSYTSELHPDEHLRYMKTFTSLDALIDSFYALLPLFSQTPVSSPNFVIIWATHLIIRVANIKLHNVFAASIPFSQKKTLHLAEECVELVLGIDLSNAEVNPIFGMLWTIIGQTIIEEIIRIDSLIQTALLSAWGMEELEVGRRVKVVALLNELFQTMELFAVQSKIIGVFIFLSNIPYT